MNVLLFRLIGRLQMVLVKHFAEFKNSIQLVSHIAIHNTSQKVKSLGLTAAILWVKEAYALPQFSYLQNILS